MELTGDLSDFALADILQILALSRKTGTLLVENGSVKGKIVLESGRITDAWANESGSFKEYLSNNGVISEETLARLNNLYVGAKGAWDFDSLLVESGLLGRLQVGGLYREFLLSTIAELVSVEKGRFGIVLNDTSSGNAPEYIRLGEGLSIEEVLLEVARDRDEATHSSSSVYKDRVEAESDNVFSSDFDSHFSSHNGFLALEKRDSEDELRFDYRDRMLSMLSELRAISFETDVSLMLLRCASELATRGILFGVKNDYIQGIGQFGFEHSNGSPSDVGKLIRLIDLPVREENSISYVARMKQPCVWSENAGQSSKLDLGLELLFDHFGDVSPLEWFIIPVVCLRKTRYILYGDNYPGTSKLPALKELLVLADQSGLVLEKLILENRLDREAIPAEL